MLRDSRGRPISVPTDPALVCGCGFDNTPLPTDRAPDRCEGCGRRL